MKIASVYDPSFRPYGRVLAGYDTAALIQAMENIAMPEEGVAYEPSIAAWRTAPFSGGCKITPLEGCPFSLVCAGGITRS